MHCHVIQIRNTKVLSDEWTILRSVRICKATTKKKGPAVTLPKRRYLSECVFVFASDFLFVFSLGTDQRSRGANFLFSLHLPWGCGCISKLPFRWNSDLCNWSPAMGISPISRKNESACITISFIWELTYRDDPTNLIENCQRRVFCTKGLGSGDIGWSILNPCAPHALGRRFLLRDPSSSGRCYFHINCVQLLTSGQRWPDDPKNGPGQKRNGPSVEIQKRRCWYFL